MTIKVTIVDDQDIIRLGIQQSLTDAPHITVLGTYPSIPSFCESPAPQHTDIVLLDDSLPDIDTEQALQMLQSCCPQAGVLVLGSRLTKRNIQRALRSGASGVVCKEERLIDVLALGIRLVHSGQIYLSTKPTRLMGQLEAELALSPRLDQVLRLIARGRSVDQMAHELGITTRAVYDARKRLRELLGVETNEQIVVAAMRAGLLLEDT